MAVIYSLTLGDVTVKKVRTPDFNLLALESAHFFGSVWKYHAESKDFKEGYWTLERGNKHRQLKSYSTFDAQLIAIYDMEYPA